MEKKNIVVPVDDVRVVAIDGHILPAAVERLNYELKNPIALRKYEMERALGRAAAELIQWEETTREDGTIDLKARLYCFAKNPFED